MQVVSNFIDNYFDQNPISQLAIVELRNGYAEKISELSGNARHHKKKLAFVFSAMRHFAHELEKKGFSVRYVHLTDKNNQGALRAEVSRAIEDLSDVEKLIVTKPGEWRLLADMEDWPDLFDVEVELRDSHGAKVRLLVGRFDHGLDRIRVLLRSERHIRIAPIGSHLLEMIILERGTAIVQRDAVKPSTI